MTELWKVQRSMEKLNRLVLTISEPLWYPHNGPGVFTSTSRGVRQMRPTWIDVGDETGRNGNFCVVLRPISAALLVVLGEFDF